MTNTKRDQKLSYSSPPVFVSPEIRGSMATVRDSGRGTIDGVEFDLLHDDIPETFRVAPPWIDDAASWLRADDHPFIWFPWYGPLEEWQAILSLRKDRIDPVYVAEHGSKIEVSEAFPGITPGATLLDADSEKVHAIAYLKATDVCGRSKMIETPIRILPRFPIWPRRTINHFQALANRLIRLPTIPEGAGDSYVKQARNALLEAERVAVVVTSEQPHLFDIVWRLISLGIEAGHIVAKAEHAVSVLPTAALGQKARARGAQGGVASGQKRTKKALAWRDPARKLAPELAAGCSNQVELAERLQDALLKNGLEHLPQQTQIVRLISELQRAKEIPPFPRRRGGTKAK